MKRDKFSIVRFSLLLALAGLFLYSASVQEIHFLFVDHHFEQNEHCDHHLHTQSNHTECALCNIDLSSYVQSFAQFDLPNQVFATDRKTYTLSEVVISNQFATPSLRGPPALA